MASMGDGMVSRQEGHSAQNPEKQLPINDLTHFDSFKA
jgi:hypothetical protein